MAFYSIEPFGHEVENMRAGTVAASVLNMNRRKKSDKVNTWETVFPASTPKIKPVQSPEQMRDILRMAGKKL